MLQGAQGGHGGRAGGAAGLQAAAGDGHPAGQVFGAKGLFAFNDEHQLLQKEFDGGQAGLGAVRRGGACAAGRVLC